MKILFISYWQKRINHLNQVLSIGICFSFIIYFICWFLFLKGVIRLVSQDAALFDWILNGAHPCVGVHSYEALSVARRLECYVH